MTDAQDRNAALHWPPRSGDTLGDGRYLLLDKLGSGGLGEVWAALEQATELNVAIKLLSPAAAADEDHLAAFEQEAAALARLDHPGLVRLLEGVDAAPGGQRYFVMELLDGRPMRLGGKPLDEVLGLFDKALEVLSFLHARDLVHLELKPDSVLMLHHGGWENGGYPIKLLDCGIAHTGETLAARLKTRPVSEEAGRPRGAAIYLSPEQAAGDHAGVGPASDLYALGVMLYEALTGQAPFEDGDYWTTVHSHLTFAPEPPIMPGVPPDLMVPLGELTLDLLQKRYTDRIQTAADARQRLAPLLGRLPAPAPLTPAPELRSPLSGGARIELPAWGAEDPRERDWSDFGPTRVQSAPLWATAAQPLAADPDEPWPLRYARELPVMGREVAQTTLQAMLGRASAGQAAGVVLTGPHGSGKAELARWLLQLAHERALARTLTLDLDARGDLVAAFRQALYRHLRRPRQQRDALRARVDEVLGFDRDEIADRVVQFIYDPGANTPYSVRPSGWRGLWTRVLRQIHARPVPRPLLIWIDGGDARTWNNAASWAAELLQMSEAEGVPLLFIWSPRSATIVPEAFNALLADSHVTQIDLGPLDRAPLRALVSRLEPRLDPTLADTLVDRCQGNPSLLTETLRAWRESDTLQSGPDGEVTVDAQTLWTISSDVSGAVLQRLAGFLGRSRDAHALEQALKRLALLGPAFTRRQAIWCVDGTDTHPDALLLQRWIKPRPLGHAPHFAFCDESLRLDILQNARERGELPALIPSCVEILLRGALDAQVLGDWETARHNLGVALDLLEALPAPGREALQLLALDALARVGHRQQDPEITGAFARALTLLADDLDDPAPALAAAGLWEAMTATLTGETDKAITLLAKVIDAPNAPLSVAMALHALSGLALQRQELDRAEATLQKARNALKEVAEGRPSGYVQRLMDLAQADSALKLAAFYDLRQNAALATRLLNRALKIFQIEGDLHGEAVAYGQLTRSLRQHLERQGKPAEADVERLKRYWDRLQALMSGLDDPKGHATVTWEAASIAELSQDWAAAQQSWRTASMLFETAGNPVGAAMATSHLGKISTQIGDLRGALGHFARFRAMALALGNPHLEGQALMNMAFTALSLGERSKAAACFDDALKALGHDVAPADKIAATLGRAELASLDGELPRTIELLKEAINALAGQPLRPPHARASLERVKDYLRDSPSLLARAARKLCADLLEA